jgi:hypothetical protein
VLPSLELCAAAAVEENEWFNLLLFTNTQTKMAFDVLLRSFFKY